MKTCPECNRTYPDDTLAFCLVDGAILSAPFDPEATQRIPIPRTTNPPATEVLSASQSIQQKGNPKLIYIVVGIMAGVIVVLASLVIIPRISGEKKDVDSPSQATNVKDKQVKEPQKTDPQVTANAGVSGAPPSSVVANTPTNSSPSSIPTEIIGQWQGQWSSPYGTIFSSNLYLESTDRSNGVQGKINWTMKSTPQQSKQSKIGLTAVEYVRGSYNQETRMLTMEGYRKDDPNSIITLDKYRLVLAEDGRSLSGATWNHGGWRGRLSLNR
jgi:hypothetical protein